MTQLDCYIRIYNPQHANRGVVEVIVDGAKIEGNLVNLIYQSEEHQMEVWLGKWRETWMKVCWR